MYWVSAVMVAAKRARRMRARAMEQHLWRAGCFTCGRLLIDLVAAPTSVHIKSYLSRDARPIANRPQVDNLPHKEASCLINSDSEPLIRSSLRLLCRRGQCRSDGRRE